MGRGGDRAAKKHEKALKRARRLRERSRRSEAVDQPEPARLPMPWAAPTRPGRPTWASSAAFTPAAAEMVSRAGMLMDGIPIHPQVVAKLREFLGWNGRGWTIGRARAAPTEELVAALEGVGVRVAPVSFAREATGQTSGWALARSWNAPAADEQFLGVTACELWRRWCPASPSMEMIEDAIQEGYACFEGGDEDGAAAIWLDAWTDLLRRLPAGVRTLEEASEACPGPQPVTNWLPDSLMAINNHAVGHPERAERGLAWVRALRERFEDRGASLVEQEAFFLQMLGQFTECEALLRGWMEGDPDHPMAYALLADLFDRPAGRSDRAAAIAVLEEALRRPVRDAEAWDLPARLASLRAQV